MLYISLYVHNINFKTSSFATVITLDLASYTRVMSCLISFSLNECLGWRVADPTPKSVQDPSWGQSLPFRRPLEHERPKPDADLHRLQTLLETRIASEIILL